MREWQFSIANHLLQGVIMDIHRDQYSLTKVLILVFMLPPPILWAPAALCFRVVRPSVHAAPAGDILRPACRRLLVMKLSIHIFKRWKPVDGILLPYTGIRNFAVSRAVHLSWILPAAVQVASLAAATFPKHLKFICSLLRPAHAHPRTFNFALYK